MKWPDIHTKIIATVGPSLESEDKLRQALEAGASIFRFNLKHNTPEWHTKVAQRVRKVSQESGIPAAVMFDLQGPDIRIGTFKDTDEIPIEAGEEIWFCRRHVPKKKTVILDYPEILAALKPGQKFYVDDGYFTFEVLETKKDIVIAQSHTDGMLRPQKGVNLADIQIPIPALVDKDIADIGVGAKSDVDFIALSFVGSDKDLAVLKSEIDQHRANARMLSKIEKTQAIENLEEIIEASDGIMVARGDLGIEMPMEDIPFLQKSIIEECRYKAKPVIVATQMLASMITNPRPTRAEVSDVANAVLDGADALMLSDETATGDYPIEAIKTMQTIIARAEQDNLPEPISFEQSSMTDVVDWSAYQISEVIEHDPDNAAFLVLTETGSTARRLSRLRPRFPIFAATRSEKVHDQLLLSRSVFPILTELKPDPIEECVRLASWIRYEYELDGNAPIIAVWGWDVGTPGQTSSVTVL